MNKLIGTYNKGRGRIFVVSKDAIDSVKDADAVIIVDDRDADDPNMQVVASYKIRKTALKREIAELMLKYDRENPAEPKWRRSAKSIVTEWKLHNFAYRLFYKRSHTADCDFNNADEGKNFFDFIGR